MSDQHEPIGNPPWWAMLILLAIVILIFYCCGRFDACRGH